MPPPLLTLVLGAAASSFSLSAVVPQVVRAARTRCVDGLSWASTVLSLATFTLWCVYAVAVADRVQVVNNFLALGLLVALAVVSVRAGGAGRASWVAAAAVLGSAAVAVATVDVFNSFVLAMAATAVSSLRMVPQTRLALSRTPLTGLDPWATMLAWVGMVLWAGYGLVVGDLGVMLCSLIAAVMQSTILWVRLPPRRTVATLAGGRLGGGVARVAAPVSRRFPVTVTAGDFELAA